MNGNNLTNLATGLSNNTVNGVISDRVNRSATSIPSISGNPTTLVTWPNALKPTCTIIGITKYNGANKGRILDSNPHNILLGHWGGRAGIVHANRWLTKTNKSPFINTNNDWVVTCARISSEPASVNTTRINDVIINNGPSGNNNKPNTPNTNYNLTINRRLNEASHFSFSALCIIDSYLSDNDMILVSTIFNAALQNPMLFNYIEYVVNEVLKPVKAANDAANAAVNNAKLVNASLIAASTNAANNLNASLNRASTNADNLAASTNAANNLNASLNRASTNADNLAASQDAFNLAASTNAFNLAASQDAFNLAASQDAFNLAASQDAFNLAASQDAFNLAASQDAANNANILNASLNRASTDAFNLGASTDAFNLAASQDAIVRASLNAASNNDLIIASINASK
jgi:hypothetical protein